MHGGNIAVLANQADCKPGDLTDFSANINPIGIPVGLEKAVFTSWNEVCHYPPPQADLITETLTQKFTLPQQNIVAGNGSTELLYALCRVANRHFSCKRIVITPPCYSDYYRAGILSGAEVIKVSRNNFRIDFAKLSDALLPGDFVIIGNPNNPDGSYLTVELWQELAQKHPDVTFLIDEAFADFIANSRSVAEFGNDNLLALRSLTKFYAIPGLRLGYALLPEVWVLALQQELPPWSIGVLEIAAAVHCLQNNDYCHQSWNLLPKWRSQLINALSEFSMLQILPSSTNFLLVHYTDKTQSDNAINLCQRLLHKHHIAVRTFAPDEDVNADYLRIAVRKPDENNRLISALHVELSEQ